MPPRQSPARIVNLVMTLVLISVLAAAMLVRFAPGFGADERFLDPRLSAEGIQLIEHERGCQYATAGLQEYQRTAEVLFRPLQETPYGSLAQRADVRDLAFAQAEFEV